MLTVANNIIWYSYILILTKRQSDYNDDEDIRMKQCSFIIRCSALRRWAISWLLFQLFHVAIKAIFILVVFQSQLCSILYSNSNTQYAWCQSISRLNAIHQISLFFYVYLLFSLSFPSVSKYICIYIIHIYHKWYVFVNWLWYPLHCETSIYLI